MITVDGFSIYHDTDLPRWHFDQVYNYGMHFLPTGYFHGPDQLIAFIEQQKHKKIACFHVPFPEENSWLTRFRRAHDISEHVFVFCSELHERTVEQLISVDLPNVTLYICGHIEHEFKHSRVVPWMDWFVTTAHFYRAVKPELLNEKLSTNIDKPKRFDVLLGNVREHRSYIFDYINSHKLNDHVVMTYVNTVIKSLKDDGSFIFEEEGLEFLPDRGYSYSVEPVRYYGNERSLSQIIPIQIYNQTNYTLVAETNFFNHFNFYTEKVVKPLIAGRLFIAVAGQNYLANLRKTGIKTFSGIIDESYDSEENHQQRWAMAMSEFEKLCARDPAEVAELVKPIVEHNRNLILTRDWLGDVSCDIKNVINQISPAV